MALKLANIKKYEKCGEILTFLNRKQRVYSLKCVFCFQLNETLTNFIEHLEQQHVEFPVSFDDSLAKEEVISTDGSRKAEEIIVVEPVQIQLENVTVENNHLSNKDPLILASTTIAAMEYESLENKQTDFLNMNKAEEALKANSEAETESSCEQYTESVSLASDQKRVKTKLKSKRQEKQKIPNPQLDEKAALPIPQLSDEHNHLLIEIYKSFPCLWNTDHTGYRFKNQRKTALNEMITIIEEKIQLKLTIAELQKHLCNIRRAYARHKHKQFNNKPLSSNSETVEKFLKNISFLSEHLGPFKCEYCGKIVNYVDQYKIHRSTHDGSLPFTCPICKRGFNRAGNCTIHIRRHTRDYDFECEICKKRFATTTDLNVHKRYHTGEKPYFCDTCGKAFRTWSFFDRHMRRHQRRPQHLCDLCKKAFYEKHKLEEHMKAHLNVRDQICNICGKSFTSTKYLRQHKQIHAEKKKYVCKICNKEFAQYAGLSGHMKSHGTIISKTGLVD